MMSLPTVLEIAIGLIFIYLTLSLVASEIQEILSALFQWRAEHLKRSVEQLIAGNYVASSRSELKQNQLAARAFADRLYETPLIKNLNYEAQGRLTGFLRGVLHVIGAIYRTLTFSRNVFGQGTSGPSYIPAETFATSLIERLKLQDFQQLLVRSRFYKLLQDDVSIPLHNTVSELRASLANEELMAAEMIYFDQAVQQIYDDLEAQRITLAIAIEQVINQLQQFENMAADAPLLELGATPDKVQTFLNRIRYLRIGLSGNAQDNAALLARLQPSLSDLTALLDPSSTTYAELIALSQREGEAVLTALDKLADMTPAPLRASLATLASRAEAKASDTNSTIQQLQAEVEGWFNNGMERATGVYRRNGKGVGLLIGFAIAFTLNADTLYMFQRLSNDPAIRSSIIQTADQLDVRRLNSPDAVAERLSLDQLSDQIEGDLRSVGSALEDTLADYPIPIGRSEKVLKAQQESAENWPIPFIPQRMIGWSITALAVSMGASFWFDLLRKVTSVRASGNPPAQD
ncbi:MAG: hypothetical protein AAFY72_06680 [Cyanobacteria bacterium J06649_4]